MTRPPTADRLPRYPASWYLFGAAREIRKGPVSKEMLGRQIVAYRGEDGGVRVMDARCSHLGADLGHGHVEGNEIVCPFHNWRYNGDGICTRVPGLKQVPSFARQRIFPALERHDSIFFFNGAEAAFPLPFFFGEEPANHVAGDVFRYVADCNWFMNSAHAFDRQHFDAVHDRRLLGPPEIDCPNRFARRNRYRAEVLGRTLLDRLLRATAGPVVEISLTVWGGTFVCITGDFVRARSRFIMVTRPLENGHTLCEGIVFAPRRASRIALFIRRFFTYGYLKDEARRIRGTRYDPARFIEADVEMVEYFHWLAALPQQQLSETPPLTPSAA